MGTKHATVCPRSCAEVRPYVCLRHAAHPGTEQGWFGGFHAFGVVDDSGGVGSRAGSSTAARQGQEQGSTVDAAAGAAAGRTSTHVLDRRWVRANQAALKDRGQVGRGRGDATVLCVA